MIPPTFVHELLSRVDIVEVVGRSVELKRAGSTWKGLCPFHGEKSPSFTVTPSRQTYHCFGCGVHGNAIGFLMRAARHGLRRRGARSRPASRLDRSGGRASTPGEREEAARQKQKQLTLTDVLARAAEGYRRAAEDERARDRLPQGPRPERRDRGALRPRLCDRLAGAAWRAFSRATTTRCSRKAASSSPMPTRRGRATTPTRRPASATTASATASCSRSARCKAPVIGFGGRVLDRGEPKYLNSPETPVFSKGRELYGLFEARTAIRQRGYALVVEGYMDVVALAQSGFENAVATLGTACTAEHVQKLRALHRLGRLQLRRRRRRAPRRGPRARGVPAARDRHAQLPLSLPASRARSGQLRARARRSGVRGFGCARGAAVAPDRRRCRRRGSISRPPKAARASWPTQGRSGRHCRTGC